MTWDILLNYILSDGAGESSVHGHGESSLIHACRHSVHVDTVSIHTVLSPIYIYIYKNYTFTFTFT